MVAASRRDTRCRARCVRPADVIRVVVQLTEAATGASIWGQTYDRDLRSAPLFETQDALTDTIVATMADPSGALVRTMTSVVRVEAGRRTDAIRSRDAALRLRQRDVVGGTCTGARCARARGDDRAGLRHRMGVAGRHLRRGIRAGLQPEAGTACSGRAPRRTARSSSMRCIRSRMRRWRWCIFSRRTSRHSVRRATRRWPLNPLDTGVMSYLGALTAYSGDWEAGLAMSERAMALNPQSSGHLPDAGRSSICIDGATTRRRSSC